jgi:hypothetical protein
MKHYELMRDFEAIAKDAFLGVANPETGNPLTVELFIEGKLLQRASTGHLLLTPDGELLWKLWSRVPEVV